MQPSNKKFTSNITTKFCISCFETQKHI